MAVISKKYLIPQVENFYFQKFTSKNGDEYGLRFGEPKDAKNISMIFKEIYNYEYLTPLVYDLNLLKRELSEKNNFWFVGESLENGEIAGAGLIKKNRYIAHASRGVTRQKFQGLGVTSKIGAAGIITATKMPEFKDCLRLNIEVRGPQIRAQKLIRNSRAIPYGLVPGYYNYGDRRTFKIENNTPFPPKREEAAFLYSIIFNTLWKKREKKIHLLNNEDFIFFHDYVKSYTKKMNHDVIILEKGDKNKGYELYGISREFDDGIVSLYGSVKEKSLNNLLKTFNNWRIILWRIPTTQNGVHSMSLALEKGFNIVGYDVGFNNMNWKLYDSVILAYYPNGGSQALEVNSLEENKPLFNKVRDIYFSRIN
ncbi:hypothetical protein LCGC14_0515750 [marine sediment metagenome]|uniref:Uncharacterized protein n=1 Tax=marine sediment metagenome TaxID=412755 RepID=A0A0F9S022_9ZZZZ|nr:hypothetical protein [archaeon]HEC37206.1 hypothetical protein [bacterium]